jgi:predicted acetyltransferase
MEHGTTERSWTIRPLTEADIEAYLDIYLNSYPAYKSLDEECRQHYRDKHRLELREDRQTQTVGLFEDSTLLATMKLIRFSMNFFGKMQPACGLMALEVHPLHKKKGVALEMVRYFEDYARRIGALLTLLLPFQIGFYRRMGYGFAGKFYEYHLPTAALPKVDAAVREHLRLMQPEDFDAALACHSRFAAKNHGMVEKFEEEVRAARGDIQVRRIGYYDGGQLRGYVAYRFESASDSNYTQNRLSVEELVYEDGAVLRALLGALRLQEDLAQTVILRTGEEDFHHLLDDPQDISKNYIDYGFLQTNVSAIGTMFKLVDGEMFVEKTAYRTFPAGTLTAAFRYRDEMADCDKCLRIAFDGGRWAVAALSI